ncbi:DinB family protein [Paenibacillus sp. TAF43_2]|uniref:DinB family protein n=1 Tax=Paenibacillus sp. TAF43_2 TaxID=3233069 RepID=UPI003F99ADBF
MNLKPMKSIYTGLLASFVFVLNAVIQFINIYLNDGPEALGFFFFLVTFVMIVFFIVYVVDVFNKNYQIIHAKMVSKHKNIIYVLNENGKVKRIRIIYPEILNELVPGQQLEITLSSTLSMPLHIVTVGKSNEGHLHNHFVKCFQHIAWANAQVIMALKLSDLPMEKSLSLLSHVLAAEKVWLTRINGEDSAGMAIWPTHTLEQCERFAEQNKADYEVLLSKLVESDYGNESNYSDSKGNPFTTKISDILTQVVLHGSYHRGQIALLLRQAGAEPILTDYIIYERQAALIEKSMPISK